MIEKTVHEPDAELMSAEEAWEDAQLLSRLRARRRAKKDSIIQVPIPFSVFISALEQFSRDELLLAHQRIQERLAT
ncbi:MAG: hypothetical protein AAF639_13660 [Chloroflexota bacterium]